KWSCPSSRTAPACGGSVRSNMIELSKLTDSRCAGQASEIGQEGDYGTKPPSAAPAWFTRSNRGEGKMPKNTDAAANSSATNAISGSGIAVAGPSGRPAPPSEPAG